MFSILKALQILVEWDKWGSHLKIAYNFTIHVMAQCMEKLMQVFTHLSTWLKLKNTCARRRQELPTQIVQERHSEEEEEGEECGKNKRERRRRNIGDGGPTPGAP